MGNACQIISTYGDKLVSIAFDKALKIRDDEIDIIQEYIYLLKDLDPKRNKNKITKLFDKIITSNSNNINTYNMLLNYSVEINDIELTRNTLEKIINETDIENKNLYRCFKSNIFSIKLWVYG